MRMLSFTVWLCILSACVEGHGSAKLTSAVFATIPVFEPSDLESAEAFGFASGSDFSSLSDYDSMHWELSSPSSVQDVLAFYQRMMPPSSDEDGDGDAADADWLADLDGSEASSPEDWTFTASHAVQGFEIAIEVTIEAEQKNGRTLFSIMEIVPEGER